VQDAIASYIQRLCAETRKHPHAAYGASPRGALSLMRAAQALAAIQGQAFVAPDHVKRLALPVLAHRIVVKPRSRVQGIDGARVVQDVLQRVEVPIDYKPSF
jgi:MoxR-like ATPase